MKHPTHTRRVIRHISILFLLLAIVPTEAAAKDIRLLSTSTFRGFVRPGPGETTGDLYPFYEMVKLNARNLGVPGLSVQASLWGRIDFLDVPLEEHRATGDVNILLLTYRGQVKTALEGLEIRVGRQFVSAGPSTYDQIDGAFVRYRSPWHVDLTTYAGLNTGIRFTRQPWAVSNNDLRYAGNWVAGGRLGYRLLDWANVGVSYRHKRYNGEVAFNELGWDLAFFAFKNITLIGDGVVELTSQRLKEGKASLRMDITKKIATNVGYRYSEPDLFIPRTSIFAVISDWTHQELFLDASWRPRRWLNISAEGGTLFFGETCTSGAIGGGICDDATIEIRTQLRADMRFGSERQHRLSLVAERYGAPDGGYTRGRVAGVVRLAEHLSAIADIDFFYLDKRDATSGYVDISEKSRFSFTGSGYLAYGILPTLTVLAGGQGGSSPYLKNFGSFIVRLTWLIDGAPIQGAVRVNRSTDPSPSLQGGVLR
ncbi:MAG: hypothetical protein KAI47_02365 [Deltaproteobacteria bacterium]|nr:hypothetical protein [Deltaproteobacteria bacterium]